MDGEQSPATSRLVELAEEFHDKRFRDQYVASHTRSVLARQMRNFRGERAQTDFGIEIGKRQTIVSRLESAVYGGWSLRTMLEIARKLNVALFCRFVDFPTFLKLSDDLSDEALRPAAYEQAAMDAFISHDRSRAVEGPAPERASVWKDFFPAGRNLGSPVNDDIPHDPEVGEQETRNRADLREQAERRVV